MRIKQFLQLLAFCVALAASGASAQTVAIEAVTTSFGRKTVTPQARFGHNVGNGEVTVEYRWSSLPPCGPPNEPTADRIERVVLLEDNVRVDVDEDYDCGEGSGTLRYTPTVPGEKIVTVVGIARNGSETRSGGVPVEMFGVSLRTSLGETVLTPYLPFTSRIFLQANVRFSDAFDKKAQFFHRSLPFHIAEGIRYSVGDKVVCDGRVFLVEAIQGSGVLPAMSGCPLADQSVQTFEGITFRYAGPRLAPGIEYFNYAISDDPAVNAPDANGPPRGLTDLVILSNNQVYEVVRAGLVTSSETISADQNTATATGRIRFTRVGSELQANADYYRGELVTSNGRIYEVVQDGVTSTDLGVGLLETDGEAQTNGTAVFIFIPSKVLREGLPYLRDDLVISTGGIYRVENAGTIAPGAIGGGLSATTEERQTQVLFRRVPDGRVYADGAVIRRSDNGQVVIPQYHKYTEINAEYAGIPLQQGVVYRPGDVVVSNGNLHQVVTGGTMGPVGGGLSVVPNQTLGGLSFRYLRESYKQISKIRPEPLLAGTILSVGQRLISNGRVYEVTGVPAPYVALTEAEAAAGLTHTSGEQPLGGFTFRYTSQPVVDVPFPYSSFDYSLPYTVKWSPAETIFNHYSWFGRYGYFEDFTVVELLTRVTDSKDRTLTSGTVPLSVLPPIDARASLSTIISTPTNDRVVAAGTAVQVTAESKDVNAVVRLVRSVQFFVDGVAIYSPDTTFPYTTEEPTHWTPTVAGTYVLNALAIDDKGNYTISPDVRINVTDNQPFIRITSPNSTNPLQPFVVAPGGAIDIQGVVSGSGGDPRRVQEIQILSDGNLLDTVNATGGYFTYSFAPTNASDRPINYQINARILDLNGATASSNTVYIQVSLSPTIPPVPTPTPAAAPEITSPLLAKGQENVPFTYQIIATNNPTSYNAAGLPPGLTVNPQNGLISGTPTEAGTFNVVLAASNSRGTGTATLSLSITPIGVTLVQFAQADYIATASQSAVSLSVTLLRAGGDAGPFSVGYGTADGSALAGRDYVGQSGTLTFAAGQTTQTITVSLVPQGEAAADRAFFIDLFNPERGVVGRGRATVTIAFPDLSTKLLNISTRAPVKTGDEVMIAGFIVQGSVPKRLVLRGIGPSLTPKGVANAVSDPTLTLVDSNGSEIAFNDDWTRALEYQQSLAENGLEPTDDREAAIVATLAPGSYTAILRGKTNGVGLVEVYDISGTASSRFVNISTRTKIEQGDSGALIAGFIVASPPGRAGTAQRVVIRALGPSLAGAGVSDELADPTLEIYRGSQKILENDNWKSNQRQALQASGLAPTKDKEAAIITDLEPGSYSAVIRGRSNATGVALAEVYQLNQ